MGKRFYFVLLTLPLLFSCYVKNDLVTEIEQTLQNESDSSETNMDLGELFHFDPIEGENYCNPDSVIEGDCFYGNLYLSANGRIVYREDCLDESEICYFTGKATPVKSGYNCVMDSLYSFKLNPSEDIQKTEMINQGKYEKCKQFSLQIVHETGCKNWGMKIESDQSGAYNYSTITRVRSVKDHSFWKEFTDIKKLKHIR